MIFQKSVILHYSHTKNSPFTEIWRLNKSGMSMKIQNEVLNNKFTRVCHYSLKNICMHSKSLIIPPILRKSFDNQFCGGWVEPCVCGGGRQR
jgi:hypothetical protein